MEEDLFPGSVIAKTAQSGVTASKLLFGEGVTSSLRLQCLGIRDGAISAVALRMFSRTERRSIMRQAVAGALETSALALPKGNAQAIHLRLQVRALLRQSSHALIRIGGESREVAGSSGELIIASDC